MTGSENMQPRRCNDYVEEIVNMSDASVEWENEPSAIAEFFAGCNVLVTGGSGFLGKLLVEKLLRCCPDISTLYVFMRSKKGKSSEERFKEQFEDPIYEKLKKQQPHYLNKVIMIEGNTEFEDLAISPENRKRLLDTHVVFHAAATVRFDDKIRHAVNINIRGTKQMLAFAKEMPNLKAFVHISTAFSHCVRKYIEEKYYEPPFATDKLLNLMDTFDDATLEKMTPILLGKWPNTYAFTKAIAEDTVRENTIGIPACIVRPSIVLSTWKEPISGWINNLYGPTGVVIGAGLGLLRTLHCKQENIADIIPADYVVSNIVAAAWEVGNSRDKSASIENSPKDSNIPENERVPIYNTVSSCQKPISWGLFMKLNEIHGIQVPNLQIMWYYMFMLNRHLFIHQICVFFLHLVPAALVDTLAYITGRKPMLLSTYKKIHKFTGVISYFSTQQWRFRNDTVMKLWDKLSKKDQNMFHFDTSSIQWDEFFFYQVRGLRMYLLNDPMSTLEVAMVRYKKLKFAHYSTLTLVSFLILWGVVSLLLYFWSMCPLAN